MLPINIPLPYMQTQWKAQLDPILSLPMSSGNILQAVSLINGSTQINHKLGRMQQGWIITDITGSATIFRGQPFNTITLTLTSSAAVTVDIFVF